MSSTCGLIAILSHSDFSISLTEGNHSLISLSYRDDLGKIHCVYDNITTDLIVEEGPRGEEVRSRLVQLSQRSEAAHYLLSPFMTQIGEDHVPGVNTNINKFIEPFLADLLSKGGEIISSRKYEFNWRVSGARMIDLQISNCGDDILFHFNIDDSNKEKSRVTLNVNIPRMEGCFTIIKRLVNGALRLLS